MPTQVEQALGRAADKLARKGKLRGQKKGESIDKAKNHFIYGIMTRMQQRGSIPAWRKLK